LLPLLYHRSAKKRNLTTPTPNSSYHKRHIASPIMAMGFLLLSYVHVMF
jgi:hypothetical protein